MQTLPVENHHITYSYRKGNGLKFFWLNALFILMALVMLRVDYVHNGHITWIYHLILSVIWLPVTLIHLQFWYRSAGITITINKQEKTLTYEKKNKKVILKKNDIESCEIYEIRSYRAPWRDYKYLYLVSGNHHLVVTCFITKPENIVKDLELAVEQRFETFPVLPLND